jgi:hypothetical protein
MPDTSNETKKSGSSAVPGLASIPTAPQGPNIPEIRRIFNWG